MMPSKAIDLGRVGLTKSLMTGKCERKSFYGERIRDKKGNRLRFPMPERVTFGRALDEAHAYIVWHLRENKRWTPEHAHELGMAAARRDEGSWALVEDALVFSMQLANAIALFRTQPEGLERLLPEIEGIRIQGNEGESLRVGDVLGTPDYLLRDGSVLDVKAAARTYDARRFLHSPEMPLYAYLATAESGALPPRLIYQVYVRLVKPKWQWLEVKGTSAHVELGKVHAAHWRAALAVGIPDLFAVDATYCHDCPFRRPLPEVGFAGCAVGMLMPDETKEAA